MVIARVRVNKEDEIKKIMNALNVGRVEAENIFASDQAIERGEKQDFDLPSDKLKIAQKFAHTGTREVKEKTENKKNGAAYNFTKRERKPNATKGGIINELADFLQTNSQFSIENLTIPNKEQKISFSIGGVDFSLTLTQHRKKK